MSEKESHKTLFDNFLLSEFDRAQLATVAHIKRLCEILDQQDEEFQHLKKQVSELETRIEKMEKSFGDESAKKWYSSENGVSGK